MAGGAWGWPAPFAAFKLTLAPFALWGVWTRRWWIGAGVGLALCLPFLAMWADYVTAMRNGSSDLAYVVADWPVAAALLLSVTLRSRTSG